MIARNIEAIRARIEDLRRGNENLLRFYGSGARPGWVSTELALNNIRIREYEAQLEEM